MRLTAPSCAATGGPSESRRRRSAGSRTASAGSCRLPSQTSPVVLPHAGDHVEAAPASASMSCTRRPASSYACTRTVCFGFGCSASGILVTSLAHEQRRPARSSSTTGSTGEAIVTQIRPSLPRAMLSG